MRNSNVVVKLLVGLCIPILISRAASAQCDSGTVTDQVATGTVKVEYKSTDSLGNPVTREVTMIRPTHFTPSIIDSVTHDPVTQLFTYKYVVKNDVTSEQQIGTVEFAIPTNVPVKGFGFEANSPGWEFFPESNPDGGFSWAFLVGTPRPNMTVEGIPPGSQASFWFESPWAPGSIKAYLRGVEPPAVFTPPVPGCIEDAVVDITGFPRDYIAIATTGPAVAP
jgi:hypothetical protein